MEGGGRRVEGGGWRAEDGLGEACNLQLSHLSTCGSCGVWRLICSGLCAARKCQWVKPLVRNSCVRANDPRAQKAQPVMNTIRNHRDLEAWQVSMDLTMETYRLTDGFPSNEMYGLQSQMGAQPSRCLQTSRKDRRDRSGRRSTIFRSRVDRSLNSTRNSRSRYAGSTSLKKGSQSSGACTNLPGDWYSACAVRNARNSPGRQQSRSASFYSCSTRCRRF